jgi:hypothetical protein
VAPVAERGKPVTVYRRNPLIMTVMGANPGSGPMDHDAARELELYVENDGDLYRQQYVPIIKNLMKRRAKGTYNRDLAVKLFMYLIDAGARKYIVEFGTRGQKIDSMFNRNTRLEVAKRFRDHFETEAGLGNYDKMTWGVSNNPIGEALLAGATSAVVSHVLQSNPHLEGSPCPTCSGPLAYQGTLGNREHYRCRSCGVDVNTVITRPRRYRGWKATCAHGEITNRCKLCRGRRVSSRIKMCPHGISGGGPRCVRCQDYFRRGTPVQSNPAIRSEWDRLTGRRRLAVLEFAGIPYQDAKYLASRTWELLPGYARIELEKGWRDTSSRSGGTTVRRMVPAMNPGPRGARKMTITVEQFADWVKKKRDPKMWKAFLAKFKGYEKWTHGARARKVHLEWVETPGVDGLWITYDGGKQPESTYIMPKGSPRKGAWKHPWDTMPDIKHDPQAGIVLTKLRGRSKITDFYHK